MHLDTVRLLRCLAHRGENRGDVVLFPRRPFGFILYRDDASGNIVPSAANIDTPSRTPRLDKPDVRGAEF